MRLVYINFLRVDFNVKITYTVVLNEVRDIAAEIEPNCLRIVEMRIFLFDNLIPLIYHTRPNKMLLCHIRSHKQLNFV